ncbi:Hypothetical protein FKW44_003470 [Caligus rogercresseyi]|uniref:Uncharacterized protein n=1 Tax=Caligus rogercresseyi TaxID=217165 RepID=A0A7T8KLY1_CALRO|nr:Hypothetical protein FKW44_003470 [Caligus rogercresseyi]
MFLLRGLLQILEMRIKVVMMIIIITTTIIRNIIGILTHLISYSKYYPYHKLLCFSHTRATSRRFGPDSKPQS